MSAGLVRAGSRVSRLGCSMQRFGSSEQMPRPAFAMVSGGAPVILTGLRPAPGAAVPGVAANHTG
eukprot:1936879-Pyramimonas_sp.AAC.1